MVEYWPNFAPQIACGDVIKLIIIFSHFGNFSPKFSDGFRQNLDSMCKIDAKESIDRFVLIAYAVHELSQKFGRRVIFTPPPLGVARAKASYKSEEAKNSICGDIASMKIYQVK